MPDRDREGELKLKIWSSDIYDFGAVAVIYGSFA
jgi:hypothetical protein